MGNDASWVTVVDVCRGSLVRARVWARGRYKVILLHPDKHTSVLGAPGSLIWEAKQCSFTLYFKASSIIHWVIGFRMLNTSCYHGFLLVRRRRL